MTECVKVVVRIRPMNGKEKQKGIANLTLTSAQVVNHASLLITKTVKLALIILLISHCRRRPSPSMQPTIQTPLRGKYTTNRPFHLLSLLLKDIMELCLHMDKLAVVRHILCQVSLMTPNCAELFQTPLFTSLVVSIPKVRINNS